MATGFKLLQLSVKEIMLCPSVRHGSAYYNTHEPRLQCCCYGEEASRRRKSELSKTLYVGAKYCAVVEFIQN